MVVARKQENVSRIYLGRASVSLKQVGNYRNGVEKMSCCKCWNLALQRMLVVRCSLHAWRGCISMTAAPTLLLASPHI